MINIDAEQLLPLSEVPRVLPPRPNGKPLHVSAVYRWAQRGRRGQRLETVKIGGTRYTSIEALQRFSRQEEPPGRVMTQSQRGRADQDAQEAARLLGLAAGERTPSRTEAE